MLITLEKIIIEFLPKINPPKDTRRVYKGVVVPRTLSPTL
jgi:hypothetical protein